MLMNNTLLLSIFSGGMGISRFKEILQNKNIFNVKNVIVLVGIIAAVFVVRKLLKALIHHPVVMMVVTIALVVAAIVGLFMYGIGLGKGNGAGDNEGDGNTIVETDQREHEINSENNIISTPLPTEVQPEPAPTSEPTPEPLEIRKVYVSINVVESKYFYNNEQVQSIEEFIDRIKAIEGVVIVEVLDTNASYKAYNTLIEVLKKEEISFVEK